MTLEYRAFHGTLDSSGRRLYGLSQTLKPSFAINSQPMVSCLRVTPHFQVLECPPNQWGIIGLYHLHHRNLLRFVRSLRITRFWVLIFERSKLHHLRPTSWLLCPSHGEPRNRRLLLSRRESITNAPSVHCP